MTTLRIGLAQTRQTSDFDENADAVLRFMDQAASANVQIVCFPETQTVGYRVDIAETHAPCPVGKLNELHEEVARRCARAHMACFLGTETPVAGQPDARPYNSSLVNSEQGQVLGVHH